MPASARVCGLIRSSAAGAVVAQAWQAAGSFGLQIIAARVLGAEGLGEVALAIGVIIMATAAVSGVVGDSLTVLDRRDPRLRSALLGWGILLSAAGGLVAAASLALAGTLSLATAAAVGVATVPFALQELVRRLLMASMRFWRLVLVDSIALAVTLVSLVVLANGPGLSVLAFFVAVAIGQAAAIVGGWALVDREERGIPLARPGAYRAVAAFGGWRGLQVTVNPILLTGVRVLVVGAAGAAALGALEAARIFVAPVALVVQGLGSYLFASYARDKHQPLKRLVRRANRASALLAAGALVLGALAAAIAPQAGGFISGGDFAIAGTSVFAWACYAAGIALVQPLASLAVARRRQRAVLGIRLLEAAASLALVALGLVSGVLGVGLAPIPLVIGLVISSVLLRILLARMDRAGTSDLAS